ncbi:MAG TPA: response regulator transcription factor [Dehalococcoidales bacterium]|jgi:NarL family two-component system response regulator LiaR|nr:response regulator transcription factor [Dehalococcoidales bacterium]
MASGIITILIADDHPTYREGLRQLLSVETDFECIGVACDGAEAIEMAKQFQPDVALIDIIMPELNGIKATAHIKASCPNTAVLVLSAFDQTAYILPVVQAGASGYLLKNSSLDDIANAIRLVHSGDTVLDSAAVDVVMANIRTGSTSKGNRSDDLGSREMEVLTLTAKGMSNKGIAEQLALSERTVQTHLVSIFKKLSVSSRTQAVLYALRKGWLSLEDLA